MTAKLDHGLLRACAAYLAHAHVYCLDEAGALSILRPTAVRVRCHGPVDFEATERNFGAEQADKLRAECDELTRLHLEAIRRYGTTERTVPGVIRGSRVTGVEATARAILDAPPGLLAWWCERLRPPTTNET